MKEDSIVELAAKLDTVMGGVILEGLHEESEEEVEVGGMMERNGDEIY
jgi:hypothetical protein